MIGCEVGVGFASAAPIPEGAERSATMVDDAVSATPAM